MNRLVIAGSTVALAGAAALATTDHAVEAGVVVAVWLALIVTDQVQRRRKA